LAILIVG